MRGRSMALRTGQPISPLRKPINHDRMFVEVADERLRALNILSDTRDLTLRRNHSNAQSVLGALRDGICF